MVIQLNGHITEEGELKLDLPSGLPAGEARITIEIPTEASWTSDELNRALQTTPLTGTEIVEAGLLGGWADQGITDSAAWVEEQRRKRRERRRW
jgi:hypothetical protein